MKKPFWGVLAVTLVGLASGVDTPVQAQGAGARAEIQARYQKLVNAWNRNVMDVFEAVHDPGFTAKGMGGELLDLGQYMGIMRSERAATSKTHSATMACGPIHSLGENEVLVKTTFRYDTTGKDWMGMFGPKGAVHRSVLEGARKDVWVRANNTWLLKSSEDLPGMKMVVDGKPWSPPAPKK